MKMAYIRVPAHLWGGSPGGVEEYWVEVLPDGSTEREFGLDPLGNVVYRFRQSHHRHLTGIFYENPWDLPTTSVKADDYLSQTLDDVHGEYVSSAEFDRVWRASARHLSLRPRSRFGRSMLAIRRALSRRDRR